MWRGTRCGFGREVGRRRQSLFFLSVESIGGRRAWRELLRLRVCGKLFVEVQIQNKLGKFVDYNEARESGFCCFKRYSVHCKHISNLL